MSAPGSKRRDRAYTYILEIQGDRYFYFRRLEYGVYVFIYTADGYEGEIIPCNEGVLEWIRKEDLLKLNLWEGDKIFLKLLQENAPFFSLKLAYKGDVLTEAVLDGKKLKKS